MNTEDLLPRLALMGGLIAAILVYRRRRVSKLQKVETTLGVAASQTAQEASEAGVAIAHRSQSLIEGVLDNIAEQALKELKTVLKDGLRRLEKSVDSL
jgi:DNA-binding TFAR19-related protein (PDSD5 family)